MGIMIYDSSGNPRVGSPVPLGCPAMGGHTGGSGIAAPLYIAGQAGATAVPSAAAAVAGTIRAMPFFCPNRKGTIDLLGAQVATGLAGNLRCAIFRNADTAGANLYPGALAVQFAAAASTAATGLKSEAVSVSFSPGELLWAAVNTDAAVVLRGVALASLNANILGIPYAATPGTAFVSHVTGALAFGAFGSTFPAGGAYVAGTAVPPALFMRFSS